MSSLRVSPSADSPLSAVSAPPTLHPGNAVEAPTRDPRTSAYLTRLLFGRRVHRTAARYKHLPWTSANGVTVARFVLTTPVLLLAVIEQSRPLMLVGLLASWGLDIADGFLARHRGRETVIGAQLDILADRMTAIWVGLGVVVLGNASALAVSASALVLVQLCFLDQLLASQFLFFRRWSPDEFHLEDRGVWRLNWAPAAKMLGNLPLGFLALGGSFLWAALALTAFLVVVRVLSYAWMRPLIDQIVTLEGHYDRKRDEVWLRLDSQDHGALGRQPWNGGRERDERGRVVGVSYRQASTKLPSDLLEMLPAPPTPAQPGPSAARVASDPAHGDELQHPVPRIEEPVARTAVG
jgi:phosphatidylglycerophosphate synthase